MYTVSTLDSLLTHGKHQWTARVLCWYAFEREGFVFEKLNSASGGLMPSPRLDFDQFSETNRMKSRERDANSMVDIGTETGSAFLDS